MENSEVARNPSPQTQNCEALDPELLTSHPLVFQLLLAGLRWSLARFVA